MVTAFRNASSYRNTEHTFTINMQLQLEKITYLRINMQLQLEKITYLRINCSLQLHEKCSQVTPSHYAQANEDQAGQRY